MSIFTEEMVKELLAFAFLLLVALGIFEFSEKVEKMGDDQE
jgi:hypothetical protein